MNNSMWSDTGIKTPIAFFIFNRPEITARVFAEIRKVRPTQLFLVGDGPRVGNFSDVEKVDKVRHLVMQIDWECDVTTNFSDSNLGCKVRLSSGIDWVFSLVDEAIFLEDDCLPSESFFLYAEQLLERFRSNQEVLLISGNSYSFQRIPKYESYFFSQIPNIWGWASWKDRWVGSYDVQISDWPQIRDSGLLSRRLRTKQELHFWTTQFDAIYNGYIDTWDYQLVYLSLVRDLLSVVPSVNLVSNIGFDLNATHTTSPSKLSDTKVFEMHFPMIHPREVTQSVPYDKQYFNKFMRSSISSLFRMRLADVFARIKTQKP